MNDITRQRDTSTAPQTEADLLRGIEAAHQVMKERDEARTQWSYWSKQAEVQRIKNEALESENARLSARLDYYQNLSTSMITKLSTINMVVNDAMRESREAALGGRASSPSPSVESTDAGPNVDIASLAARLAPEPYVEPAK